MPKQPQNNNFIKICFAQFSAFMLLQLYAKYQKSKMHQFVIYLKQLILDPLFKQKPEHKIFPSASFTHLLCAIPACNALFEKKINSFSVKLFKTTCCLRGCSISNALNLEKLESRIHNLSFY